MSVDPLQVWTRRCRLVTRDYEIGQPMRPDQTNSDVPTMTSPQWRPFYIVHTETPTIRTSPGSRSEPHTISETLPIFTPARVRWIREKLHTSFAHGSNEPVDKWARKAHTLALVFDDLSQWPETDPITRNDETRTGLFNLRSACDQNLGMGVVDILRWHGVLRQVEPWPRSWSSTPLRLDVPSLDLWTATAILIASTEDA
jgi:hypothetical protein